MNLDKLFTWIIGVVIAFAACGQLDTLQRWIWRAQARVVFESRTSTWGSPRFFNPQTNFVNHKNRMEKQARQISRTETHSKEVHRESK